MMLETLVVIGAALILALLGSTLIFAPPDNPVRQPIDRRPTGEADLRE